MNENSLEEVCGGRGNGVVEATDVMAGDVEFGPGEAEPATQSGGLEDLFADAQDGEGEGPIEHAD